jgi:hypothetical protein
VNPDPNAMSRIAYDHARAERVRRDRQASLHRAAIERRRKAKRGGKR